MSDKILQEELSDDLFERLDDSEKCRKNSV